MPDHEFDPQRILDALAVERVRFVLVGGMAAVLHGDVGVTLDVDITPAPDEANLDSLARALRSLNAR
ncbi:MAG: nucleotidyltransferase, partial [Gammaproteobacteria bacterium]|nr:nucleotidyltransferase [Gammaproteobacteria bacterium]